MKIILIGFMGSGKSTVAKEISQQLKLPILEMDEIAYQKTNTYNMHELFAKGGESLLRQTEISIAQEYALVKRVVISTGGGVVLTPTTMEHLKKSNGKVFFLNASFPTIADRLKSDTSRPLYQNKIEAEALFCYRQPLYLKYSDYVINVDKKTIQEIAREILEQITMLI